ncbi:BID domain-containing T4SS effector [Bartonella harrusi]|uniref:BID domain-containing T4SS effector n=1 Tax=Bartonella harrusi TaxID=2961895 RepID=A0ABY5EV97_9HYPH|nr:BID domain-containing T4SS effector [Bartonella harrusi]UTO28076.1 BID domain-containing T4SS effector [Bartonella harrusi]
MKKHQPKHYSPPSNPEALYAAVEKPKKEQGSHKPEETVYAPQHPPQDANPYARPRSEPTPQRPVDPYAVTDLSENNWRSSLQEPKNWYTRQHDRKPEPEHLYAEIDVSGNGGRNPTRPLETVYAQLNIGGRGGPSSAPQEEHLYADLDFGRNGGRNPTQSVETVYAKLGMGSGGPDAEHRENPIYQSPEAKRRTTPPQTEKDLVTSAIAKDKGFQDSLVSVQEWCEIVFGNGHALNKQLAQILDNPSKGRDILQSLMENPECYCKLAGQKTFGIKSQHRKQAEEGFGSLCDAFERHVKTAEKLHRKFTHEHRQDKGVEKGQESPEHRHHRHHHRHHRRDSDSPERETQSRGRQQRGGGMAFAM